jgi:two-component system chemotaxis response regulator CheB
MPAEFSTRVVVADDSALMRRIVTESLTSAGIDVVGQAADGDQALACCRRQAPDALMLDLSMPGLDGIGVLKAIAVERPQLPVIVVSAFSPAQGARAVDALAEGAFDLVAKPAAGESLESFAATLVEKLHAATAPRLGPSRAATPRFTDGRLAHTRVAKAVIIATSTGGPKALAQLLPALPGTLGVGTLIVQHMPAGFTRSLASRLDDASALTVHESRGGELLDAHTALLAPGGKHLRLTHAGVTQLTDDPPIGALRPRADLTIKDAASAFGDRLLLVVMTGMGNDGLIGAREVKRRGGRVLVEAQSTCTVYGMPRAVAEAGLADASLPLSELAAAIGQEASA